MFVPMVNKIMPVTLKYSKIFFSFALVLILYLFYRMIEPFLISVILSLTLVSLFYANYLELNRKLKDRPNLSSALMVIIVTTLIIIPFLSFLSPSSTSSFLLMRVSRSSWRAEISSKTSTFRKVPSCGT